MMGLQKYAELYKGVIKETLERNSKYNLRML